ncbi:hypothetical protein D3C81_2007630 [compost metagenome]
MAQPVSGRQLPVLQECNLQIIYGVSLQTQMGIAPIAHFGIFAQIIIPDIHPSRKSYQTVDNHNFTVIPVIEPAVQERV